MRLRSVDRVVLPPAALLNADRTPLVLQKGKRKKFPTKPQHQTSKNAIYTNACEILGVYLGEEAVLGEKLGDLGREDDVPAPDKGDRVRVLPTTEDQGDGKG